jgi:hypothetical protein
MSRSGIRPSSIHGRHSRAIVAVDRIEGGSYEYLQVLTRHLPPKVLLVIQISFPRTVVTVVRASGLSLWTISVYSGSHKNLEDLHSTTTCLKGR